MHSSDEELQTKVVNIGQQTWLSNSTFLAGSPSFYNT
jgi:hypothetical protein